MITKFKIFESNVIVQQPFFLTKGDILYLSNDMAKKVTPTPNELRNMKRFPITDDIRMKRILDEQKSFFSDEKYKTGILKGYKVRRLPIWKSVGWRNNTYRMDLILSRGVKKDNNAGIFYYYITGNSGNSEMHGRNMVRGTRDANLNFMILYYPIVRYIKNFYKKLKDGELFFDIIKKALEKDIVLARYCVPKELEYIFSDSEKMVKNVDKYNL